MTEQLNPNAAASSVNLVPIAHYGQNIDRLAEEAQVSIVNYRPQIPATEWEALRPFVVDVATSVPFRSLQFTKLLLRALTRLGRWARTTAMLPLDADVLLDPDTINEACHSYTSRSVASVHQWALLRAAEERGEGYTQRSLDLRRRSVRPLDYRDLAELSTSIASFTAPRDIRTANAAMAACGGAGLRFHELLNAKTTDVARTADGWTITVPGDNSRTIAVLDDWASYLDRALEVDTGDDWLICSGVNYPRARQKKYSAQRQHHRYPDCQRLRSTWLARMCGVLTVGELVYAAGYRNAGALTQFDPWLVRRPDERLLPILRSGKEVVR